MNFIENDSFSIGKTHTKRELCNPKEGIIVGGDVPVVNETTVNGRLIASALEMLIYDKCWIFGATLGVHPLSIRLITNFWVPFLSSHQFTIGRGSQIACLRGKCSFG
jgi:hypothetical protein